MRALPLIAMLALVACNGERTSSFGPRFVGDPEGFSCELPKEWAAHRERGAVIFASAAAAKRTIAVRSVPLGGKSSSQIERATELVLERLPGAQILGSHPVEGSLSGTAYELTFVPPGMHARYVRTHVVLVGQDHVFHIIDTAPVSASPHDGLVANLIASFREEV